MIDLGGYEDVVISHILALPAEESFALIGQSRIPPLR